MTRNNFERYLHLRGKYPEMIFDSYFIVVQDGRLDFGFEFSIPGLGCFRPEYKINLNKDVFINRPDRTILNSLVFNIGMIELISYWKLCCPPRIMIRAGNLTVQQKQWWRKLYYHGLGEFFHTNGIINSQEDFIEEFATTGKMHNPVFPEIAPSILVPVGGGKDSAVTLEILRKQGRRIIPFAMNPREAILRTVKIAGFDPGEMVVINRTLDPLMLELNGKGFLNGHTPFSALLAFVSVLGASLTGSEFIALSNESSANEPTIPGTMINHQYSKSFHFEKAFREYLHNYLVPGIEYFSMLRPLNELQIARLFSGFDSHFGSFRSCNAGSKTDTWCGKCSKCLFTYIILSPFVEQKILRGIFGRDLLEDRSMQHILNDLTGLSDEKPFECVGTIEEVKVALDELLMRHSDGEKLPALLDHYKKGRGKGATDPGKLLGQWSGENFVPEELTELLKNHLNG